MKITSFHIEASTYCNARCPGCPRNIRGYNLKNLVETRLANNRMEGNRQVQVDALKGRAPVVAGMAGVVDNKNEPKTKTKWPKIGHIYGLYSLYIDYIYYVYSE